jgi:glycine/D-amino acid oxidase-like deaminating enzyme
MHAPDFLIIGQGLAGTSLAWELLARGRSVHLVDRNEPMTASRVTAGLLNPIIGRNMNLSWRFRETFEAAQAFYRQREDALGCRFFHHRKLVRLFKDTRERDTFVRKRDEGLYEGLISDPQPDPLVPPGIANDLGGFEISHCGSIETKAYLDASRRHFGLLGAFTEADCDTGELDLVSDGVRWRDIQAGQAVLCRGFRGSGDVWFPWIPFRCAKGEILEIRLENHPDDRILNRGNWLFPTRDGRWRTGTTYAWEPLDTVPSEEARQVIEQRLHSLLPEASWTVDAHHAAVRPIVHGRKPVLGRHPDHPALAIFNGLGSKGALHAPWCARQLADHLLDGCPLEPEVDLAQRFPRD